jgi:hypothetical protein
MTVKRFAALLCCAVLTIATPAFAQETAPEAVAGPVTGSVFAKADGEKTPLPTAKLTLSQDGVVIQSVEADEKGTFSFASVEPGTYQMFGSSGEYFGGSDVIVGSGGVANYDMGLSQGVAYDSYAAAPASSCGGGCAGGCGGGGGFLRGGRGGGLLRSRFGRLALIGGVVAIATGGEDEASPDGI